MHVRDRPPTFLYKYATSGIYDTYLRQDRVRFGTSADYRAKYEANAGYADKYDGVRSARLPRLNCVVSTANHHYLFCLARSYSYEAHRLWLERQDCGYDLCVVFDGEALVGALASAVRAEFGKRIVLAGSCVYGEHRAQENALRGNVLEDALVKPTRYAIEDEYRFAVALAPQDPNEPRDVLVPGFHSTVRQLIRLTSPSSTVRDK